MFQKLGGIGREDFGGGAGRGGAEVSGEVGDREIDLVSHGTHHRDRRGGNGAGEDFLVEFPEVLEAPAAAGDDDHIGRFDTRGGGVSEDLDSLSDFGCGTPALDAHRKNQNLDSALAAVEDLKEISDRRAGGRGNHGDAAGEFREWAFARRVEESLSGETALEFLELGLKRPDAALLHAADDELVVAARFVDREFA